MPRPLSIRARASTVIAFLLALPVASRAFAQVDYLALCRAEDATDRLRVEACGFAGHDDALTAQQRADALSRRAEALLNGPPGNGNLRELARLDFEQALRLAPDDIDVKRRYLAFNNHWTGKPEAQLATANALLAEDSRDASTLLQRGLVYMRTGENEKALVDVTKASEIDPKNADAWIALGQILTKMMRNEESYQAYTKALALAPGRDEIRLSRMGPALVSQHFETVRDDGNATLGGKFANARLWDIRGAANYVLQDYAAADKDFAQQLKLDGLGVRALVWRFLARHRGGAADKGDAAEMAADLGDQWPSSVFAYFAGAATEDAVFAQIDQSPAELRATRIAQAHFYLAEWGLVTQAPMGTVKAHLMALRDAGLAFGMAQTTVLDAPAVMNDNNILEMAVGASRLREFAP